MKARHLVWIRRISQTLFLCFFIYLLIESRLPQDTYQDYTQSFSVQQDLRLDQPVKFFFQLDPLVVISSLFAGRVFIQGFLWGVAVLLMTLILGRVFCGFICPFGTIHHLIGGIRPALKGKRLLDANRKKPSQRLKYFILIFLLTGAVLGLNWVGLMDPISLLFRSVALAVLPGLGAGVRMVFDAMAASDVKIINLMSYSFEVLLAPVFGYSHEAYQTAWLIGIVFLVILFLNRIRPRFWCRTLCPLGALLGIFSRFSLLRLEKYQEKCTDCKRCTLSCQGAAEPHPDQTWQSAECVACFNCFDTCPEDALAFKFKLNSGLNPQPDIGKRAVLTGLVAGISLPLIGRLDGRIDRVADPRLIRPPGSLPESEFLELCQRCGQCMKVCPTNVINPTLGEAGMAGFWTPHLIMTQGYCEYTCTLCGSVCPTGAIDQITAAEKTKTPIRIGSAYVDRGRCLPWSGNAPCIVCQEHCPTSPKAIYLIKDIVDTADGKKIEVQLPFVNLQRCVGCGICENRCPVRGLPAIRTISAGETRDLDNQILIPL